MNHGHKNELRRGIGFWLIVLSGLLGIMACAGERGPLVRNTVLLVLSTLAMSLPVGALLAFLLARTNLPGRRILAATLGLLLFVPLYLQAAGWLAGFGIQGWFTLANDTQPWIAGWRGAVWIHSCAAVPWVALIVAAGLLQVEPELEEDALLDTSPLGVLWYVTLPRSAAALGAAALWVAIVTAGEMTVTDLFQIRTYAEEIYTQISSGARIDELTLGWMPSLLFVLCMTAAGLTLCIRMSPAIRWPTWRHRLTFPLGAWRWPLAFLVALLMFVLLGVPLANLAYKAGLLTRPSLEGLERSWSFQKTARIVASSPWSYAREFRWSLMIGSLAATAAVVAGTLLAWFARRGGLAAAFTLIVVAALLSLPGPLLGLGFIWLLNRSEVPWLADLYDYSILAPWAALTSRALPFTLLILWQALRSVPQETLEAAEMDGAGPWARLFAVALPQRRAALAVAWLVAFAVTLSDLAASILVVPPGVVTVPIQIFSKLHYGQEDDVAGICLATIGLFALLAAMIACLVPRRRG